MATLILSILHSENLAAHMRLTAALGLMKMAAYRVYDKAIDEDLFEAIILVVQVSKGGLSHQSWARY